jgi:cytidylate kinase
MNKPIKIAIDGPAGSGKSTVAKIIAEKLNIEYIDSGSIYRAITKNILDSNIKIDNYSQIEFLLNKISIKLVDRTVLINNNDYSKYIRGEEVSLAVSPVSSIIAVRKKVNAFLNTYSKGKSIIMDGRDIGTVVFPDADYKFYLDASIEERALRRFKEKTMDLSLDKIKEEIKKRDNNDKNKKFGALKVAKDAINIDTTNYTINEVVEIILKNIVKNKYIEV